MREIAALNSVCAKTASDFGNSLQGIKNKKSLRNKVLAANIQVSS